MFRGLYSLSWAKRQGCGELDFHRSLQKCSYHWYSLWVQMLWEEITFGFLSKYASLSFKCAMLFSFHSKWKLWRRQTGSFFSKLFWKPNDQRSSDCVVNILGRRFFYKPVKNCSLNNYIFCIILTLTQFGWIELSLF